VEILYVQTENTRALRDNEKLREAASTLLL
jgi:hypothetical protein